MIKMTNTGTNPESQPKAKKVILLIVVFALVFGLISGLVGAFIFAKPGPQGSEGPQGLQGVQGIQGEQGIQGIQGEPGIQGIRGEQGVQGPIGSQGIQGIQGLQGYNGSQGLQGPIGPQGEQGIQGIQGIQGEQGPQGIQGEPGLNGTNTIQQMVATQNLTAAVINNSYKPGQWYNMSVLDSSMKAVFSINEQSRILAEFSTSVSLTNSGIWFRIVIDNQYFSAVCYTSMFGTTMDLPIDVKILTGSLSAGQHTIEIQFYRVSGTTTLLDRSLYLTELPAA